MISDYLMGSFYGRVVSNDVQHKENSIPYTPFQYHISLFLKFELDNPSYSVNFLNYLLNL